MILTINYNIILQLSLPLQMGALLLHLINVIMCCMLMIHTTLLHEHCMHYYISCIHASAIVICGAPSCPALIHGIYASAVYGTSSMESQQVECMLASNGQYERKNSRKMPGQETHLDHSHPRMLTDLLHLVHSALAKYPIVWARAVDEIAITLGKSVSKLNLVSLG